MDRPREFESLTSWFVAKCSNPIELRADIIIYGGNGKSRTYTWRRMKAVHYHYATLPGPAERIELSQER